MRYRKLGRTELNVSLLGFGASPLGNVFGITDPAKGERAVHVAVDHGINFFDASPYYGSTLAEERLGVALQGRRDKVVLATKCGRYGANEFDFSATKVKQSIDQSLCRLKTDYVDLFQAHDIEFGDANQIMSETIPAMRELQKQGKARFIGITGYPLKLLRRVAETVPVDTVLSYCRYNLVTTDMDDILTPFVQQHEIGLINASPLLMGMLTAQGPADWHPAPPEVREAASQASRLCAEHGVDFSRIALQFCLQHPCVASTLTGMSTPQEVEENLQAVTEPIDKSLLAQIRAILRPVLNTAWKSGRPENQD